MRRSRYQCRDQSGGDSFFVGGGGGGYSICSYSISVETLNMATREGIVCESDGRAYIPASQRPNVKHGNTGRDCVEGWKGIPTSKPAAQWVMAKAHSVTARNTTVSL